MNYLTYLSLFGSILLCACNKLPSENKEKQKDTTNIKSSSSVGDIVQPIGVISINESLDAVRDKTMDFGRMTNQEYEELELYDDYFKSKITMLTLKDKGDMQRNLTIIFYQNKIRYIKALLHHVGNTNPENIKKYSNKMEEFSKAILSLESAKRLDKNYLTAKEGEEIWVSTILKSESLKNGRQDYYFYCAPEREYDYLKFMITNLVDKSNGKFKIDFLINN